MFSKQTHLVALFLILFTIVSCEKEISVSGPKEYDIGTAKLFVSTTPPGALIFVDGKNTGCISPDTVNWLSEGSHKFELRLEPFLDHTFTKYIFNDTINTKDFVFYSDSLNFGSVKFNSSPNNCSIFLNDTLLNFKTPYILEDVYPGSHKVKYSLPEHRSDSSFIYVLPGKRTYINMNLTDTTVWVNYNIDNSFLNDNTINDIFIDVDNTLWIGTSRNGIIKITNESKEYISTNNSNMPSDIIIRINKDKFNNIWVATYFGLAKISGEEIMSYTISNSGLPHHYISDFDFDREGNIWIGTAEGLVKFDGSNWIVYNTKNSRIPENFITSVLVDNNDNIWIGTNEFNTTKFNQKSTWITYQADNNLIGDSVSDFIIGHSNYLWVGLITENKDLHEPTKPGGVYALVADSLMAVIEGVSVHRFFKDDNNTIWITTQSGIFSIDAQFDINQISAKNSGLPIDDVLSVSKDKNGNMWFGTNGSGLVQYKIGGNTILKMTP